MMRASARAVTQWSSAWVTKGAERAGIRLTGSIGEATGSGVPVFPMDVDASN